MKYLLVVDVQQENGSADLQSKRVYKQCLDYIGDSRSKYDQVISINFLQDLDVNNNTKRYAGIKGFQNTAPIEFPALKVFYHEGYSYDDKDMVTFSQRDVVDIIGFNTDAQVLATAFKVFDCGCEFNIISKLCWSTSGKSAHISALKLMKKLFGSAVI